MKAGLFFLKSAFTQLRRGGQRNLVAFFCVAFGVMSLVAMTTLSKSIEKMLVLKPYELIGGDLTVDKDGEESISMEEEQGFKKLLADGVIDSYTIIDYYTSLGFRLTDSAEMIFPAVSMGIDSDKYPLSGNLAFVEPKDAELFGILKAEGDLIITRDIALTYKLDVGDSVLLSNLDYGQPITATIRGIASDTPNHQGSKIYFNHQTSQALTGLERNANTVLVNAGDPVQAETALLALGWRVFTAENLAGSSTATEKALAMGLNDIGLLGLLVSGIGIANTMQVLLRRRRKEVAVWKTLGYSARRIQSMFVLEATLLGLSGSLVGTVLGVVLSWGMVGLFSRITSVLVTWSFSPVEAISGLVIGTVTTVIFAMWAIVSTSRVTPLSILRNEVLDAAQIPAGQALLLGLMLVIPFAAIAVWVLKSFMTGLLVLIGTIIGLAMLGGILWLLVLLVIKLLPTRSWALGKISRNNLSRRGGTQVFAMVALFLGVFMLGFGTVLSESGNQIMGAMKGSSPMENLALFVRPEDETEVQTELNIEGITEFSTGHLYQVNSVILPGEENYSLPNTLMTRSTPGSITIIGAEWGSRPDGIYVYPYTMITVGTLLNITATDGSQHKVEVVGSYENNEQAAWPGMNGKLLLSEELGAQLGTPISSQYFLTVPQSQLNKIQNNLAQALPQTTLLNLAEYQMHFMRQYQNLFVFVAAMAGLAILAGILLMANSVSLAMLDRRFEIGVLKSIGYSRGQVLFTQVVEYTLMSVVVSLVALLLIWGMIGLLRLLDQTLGGMLVLPADTAAIIALIAVGLTALTVLWAAWKPCNVSPVFVLNDRE